MKKYLLILFFVLPLFAANLTLKEGFVAAHTEMMMDSTIDPMSTQLNAAFTLDGDTTTLRGKTHFLLKTLSSDNKDRDEHMYEQMEVEKYPTLTFMLESVTKESSGDYTLQGTMDLHGVKKPVTFTGEIIDEDNKLTINAKSSILMTDFKIEPPCMMFMCVRDQLDLFVKVTLIK